MTRFYQLFITGASKELTKSKHKGKNNQEKFLKYGQDPAEKKKRLRTLNRSPNKFHTELS